MKIILALACLLTVYTVQSAWVDDVGILERNTPPAAKARMGTVWVDAITKDLMFLDSDGAQYNILLGGSIGGAKLNDLSDVDTFTASPTAGSVLGFDGTVWKPSTVSSSLSGLSDVDLTTVPPTANKVLGYDGTKWVPATGGKALIAGQGVTITQDATTATISSAGKTLVGSAPIVITQDSTTATLSLGQTDYLDFNTAYSPSHLDGRVHYDSIDKTLSVDIDSANGVELQVGQEQYIRAVNKTGGPLTDGQVVYVSGAQGNRPTITQALATTSLSNRTIGVLTQNIADNGEGMVTTSGVVGGFNTSGFTAGDRLYLSNTVAGGITNILPYEPIVQIGWALNSTVSGKILVDIKSLSPVGQSIVGDANNFYLDATASFADNLSLSTTPSSYPQVTNTKATTSALSPVFMERFVSGALGRTSIPAGTWNFDVYAGTSNTAGLNEIKFRVNRRVALSGCTGTFTGAGATRTFTATGCTPFVAGDATGSILTATLIETPTQTAWISGYTSSSVVTVTLTDPGFANVSNVPFNGMYYLLFNTTTGDINSTSELKIIASTQGAFSVNETDRIVLAFFSSTDQVGSRNISMYYGGTARFTHFDMPSSVNHNDLASIQGGSASQYYHLNQSKYNAVENLTASGTMTLFTGDTQTATGNCTYYGDSVTDGSHRSCQVGGALIYSKRVSGSWSETFRVE